MQGVAVGALRDLLAAAEAVGNDKPVGGRFADGGQEFELADGGGDVVLVVMEAEGTSHAAASGGGRLEVHTQAVQKRFFGGHLHDGLVMAVAVEQRLAFETRERRIAAIEFEKLAEEKCLSRQGLRPLVV